MSHIALGHTWTARRITPDGLEEKTLGQSSWAIHHDQ
jgi:hypothetical protein